MKELDLNKNIEDILLDLIKISSETNNEENIINTLKNTLKNHSFLSFSRVNNSLIYSIGNDFEDTIALIGHIDTVKDEKNLKKEIKEGFVYGRGSVDMKQGIACMLKLIYEINEKKITLSKNIKFIFYEKEEGPLPNGISFLNKKNLLEGIDFAYVLEPTNQKYLIGCLGSISIIKNFLEFLDIVQIQKIQEIQFMKSFL